MCSSVQSLTALSSGTAQACFIYADESATAICGHVHRYGDMVPTSDAGKLAAATTAAVGVVLLAIPGGIFLSALFDIIKLQKQEAEENEHKDDLAQEHAMSAEYKTKKKLMTNLYEAIKFSQDSLRNAQLMEMQPSKKEAVESTVMALLKSVRKEGAQTDGEGGEGSVYTEDAEIHDG